MNKYLKFIFNAIFIVFFVVFLGSLGYTLTLKYKYGLENTFSKATKEISSYIDYYLNFIFES